MDCPPCNAYVHKECSGGHGLIRPSLCSMTSVVFVSHYIPHHTIHTTPYIPHHTHNTIHTTRHTHNTIYTLILHLSIRHIANVWRIPSHRTYHTITVNTTPYVPYINKLLPLLYPNPKPLPSNPPDASDLSPAVFLVAKCTHVAIRAPNAATPLLVPNVNYHVPKSDNLAVMCARLVVVVCN